MIFVSPRWRRVIHNTDLPMTVQCTGVRLLLNLAEVLMHRCDGGQAEPADQETYRGLLNVVLATLACKLRAVARVTLTTIAGGAPCAFLLPVAATVMSQVQASNTAQCSFRLR